MKLRSEHGMQPTARAAGVLRLKHGRSDVRIVQYLLQAAIVLFGGSALVALARSPRFELFTFIALFAFFVFLFFLTFLLEATEARLVVGRQVNTKVVVGFPILAGIGFCWLSIGIVNGYTGPASGRGALLRVTLDLLGPWPPAVFFSVVGLCALGVAYRALRLR